MIHMRKLEDDLEDVGLGVGEDDYSEMMYFMPRSDESIGVNDVIRLNVSPGEIIVIRIPLYNMTQDQIENICKRWHDQFKDIFGEDIKILVCDKETDIFVCKEDRRIVRKYNKVKKSIGIWR